MNKRNILSFLLTILVAFTFLACGGSGGGDGGGNGAPTYSLVGTWDLVSWSGGVNQPPAQITFNADGTGSTSESTSESAANLTAFEAEASTFTWSVSGNTLTGNFIHGTTLTADLAWTDNEHVKMTITSGEDNGMVINSQRRSSTTNTSTYSISGTVTSSGIGLQGVSMTLSTSTTVTTDASGNYTFTGLTNGSCTITPSKAGYTFNPTSSTHTVNSANITGVNFIFSATPVDVTGTPVDVTGTWSGMLTINGQYSGAFTYVLTQSGSAITGTYDVVGNHDNPDGWISSAILTGNSLTIISYPAQHPSDDCHLYSKTDTFTVSGTTMSLTSASGTECHGDGQGGHDSLIPITIGSGTLNKI